MRGGAYLARRGKQAASTHTTLRELAPIAIVAPHPDDETLGCGELIASCADAAVPIVVITLTDGEASHPNSRSISPTELAKIRRIEQASALSILSRGKPLPSVRLGWADGRLEQEPPTHQPHRASALQQLFVTYRVRTVFVSSGDDDHGDHRVAYRLARSAAQRQQCRLFTYSVWPTAHSTRSTQQWQLISPRTLGRKRDAVYCYASQLGQVVSDDDSGFRMPEALLERALGAPESFTEISYCSSGYLNR